MDMRRGRCVGAEVVVSAFRAEFRAFSPSAAQPPSDYFTMSTGRASCIGSDGARMTRPPSVHVYARLERAHAAVDHDLAANGIGGLVGCEEHDGFGDFRRRAEPAGWYEALNILGDGLQIRLA